MSVNHSTVVELEHHNIMALGERVEFTSGIRFLNPRHASYCCTGAPLLQGMPVIEDMYKSLFML